MIREWERVTIVRDTYNSLDALEQAFPVGTDVVYRCNEVEAKGTVHGVCRGLPRQEGREHPVALVVTTHPHGGVGQVYPDEVRSRRGPAARRDRIPIIKPGDEWRAATAVIGAEIDDPHGHASSDLLHRTIDAVEAIRYRGVKPVPVVDRPEA